MNEMPRNIEETMSKEIAEEMTRLNRASGNPAVDRPSHYLSDNGLEVIDVIEGFNLTFHEGNVIKYLLRWRQKGGLQDLQKARWYLDRFIDREERAR